MGYTLHFDKWNSMDEEYENLSWEVISGTDSILAKTEAFEYWLNENYRDEELKVSEIVQRHLSNEGFDAEELMDEFRSSEDYYDLMDRYVPIYNYVHLLSRGGPSNDDLILLYEHVGNVVVVHLNDIDADVLALTGCGMDLSDNLELAYFLIDGYSPLQSDQVMSLSKNAEKLLYFCRKKSKENGHVSTYGIRGFIDNGYKDEEE